MAKISGIRSGKHIVLSGVAVRVSVEYTPQGSLERRLVSVDLWLIERVPGGERSQPLSIRELPHREIPFYFDAITENALSLEVLGHVAASPESEAIAIRPSNEKLLGTLGIRLAGRQTHADAVRRFALSHETR